MNTWGCFNSPVVNTSGSRLPGVFRTSIRTGLQRNFLVIKRPGSKDSLPSVLITGKSQLPEVLCTSSFFVNQVRPTTPGNFDSLVMNTPSSNDSTEENTTGSRTPRWWIPYYGESITNSNNSSNIRKNSKSFLRMSNGTRRSCLMKKQREKISWNCPFVLSKFLFFKMSKFNAGNFTR